VDRARVFLGICGAALSVGCEPTTASSPRLDRASLTVFYTADLHSHVFPHRFVASERDEARGLGQASELVSAGGFSRLGGLLESERGHAERSLYLDGGDLFQGGRAFDLFGGEAELVGAAALGLDAMVLGNHDLDDGAAAFAESVERFGTFPVLATNYVPLGKDSVHLPWVIFDVRGLRVGVVGVANVESVGELERGSLALGVLPREETEAVQEALDALGPACDVTIALTHLGLDRDRELVSRTVGLDLVLGAHQHLTLDAPELARDRSGREVPIVHVGAYGRYLGRIRLTLSRGRTSAVGLERREHALSLLAVGEGSPESQHVIEALSPYRDELEQEDPTFAYVEAELARSNPSGGDSPLEDLVADAAWLAGPADLALVTSSSLRADLLPGPLTASALHEALPFDDPLVRLTLSGRELEGLFEKLEGRAVRYDCETPVMVAGAVLRFSCGGGAPKHGVFPVRSEEPCARDAECEDGVCAPTSSGARRCFRKAPPRALLSLVTTRFLLEDYGLLGDGEVVADTLRGALEQRVAAMPRECPGRLPCVRAPSLGRVEMGQNEAE
jgi:5'-nucleotidase/UDP-sugar diphosphatase